MVIEAGALYLIGTFVAVVVRFIVLDISGELSAQALATTERVGVITAWLAVFAFPALAGRGSLGLGATWMVPVWPEGTSRLWFRRLLRASIVSVPWVAGMLSPGLQPLGIGVVIAAVASVPFTRNSRGLTCALTGADLQDMR